MTPTLHAACSPGEVRVAVWDGRSLLDYAIWRPGRPDGVGDLHRGRVSARAPAMAGAFVALGIAADGFLPDSAGGGDVTEGAMIAVRIVRASQGGKGPRLTARLDAADRVKAGTGAPAPIEPGAGAIERLAALHPHAPILIDDAGVAASLRAALGAQQSERIRIVADAFADESLRGAVDALSDSAAALPGGATLHVYPTPALVALDVDLGRATAERRAKAASQMAANTAIIPAIARQIRLRNLGGAILLDLAGLAVRRRQALAPALQRALSEDPLEPRLLGFTALGLAEILRPRIHPPLHELLSSAHAAALSALRAAEAACLAAPGQAPRLRAAAQIVAALAEDSAALDDFARRTGHRIAPVLDPALRGLDWRL